MRLTFFFLSYYNYFKYTCPTRADVTCMGFLCQVPDSPISPMVLNFAKFCDTKEDCSHVYGLSLEGIDLAFLTHKLISYMEWLLVYTVPKVKGKVKVKHVRPELYDDCMRLHLKVH